MDDFVFFNPVKVYFGKEQLCMLKREVEKYGKRVLIVYGGKSIKENGIYDQIINEIDGLKIFELSGVNSNPDVDIVRIGAAKCKENKIDVILAIGGGSVIDASKWIAAAACVDFDAWDFFSRKTTIEKSIPIITVVTIASTGSEMNSGGVISNRKEKKKIGRGNINLFPKASFLNPEFTFSVNKYQTACGAVDILSHLIEVYFHNYDRFDMLDGVMESMMRTVIKYALIAYEEPNNYEARANLLWTASWAINGFINGGVRQGWNCHTIEHELSARFNITHGQGMAILIPTWLKYSYYKTSDKERYKLFAKNVLCIKEIKEDELIADIVERINEIFFSKLNLKVSLQDYIVSTEELIDIANTLCNDGPIKGFVDLYKEDIIAILKDIY